MAAPAGLSAPTYCIIINSLLENSCSKRGKQKKEKPGGEAGRRQARRRTRKRDLQPAPALGDTRSIIPMVALECPALSANPAANQSNNHCGICCGIPRRCWEGDRGMGPAGVALGGGSRESRRWSEVTKAAWHPSDRGILRLGGPLMPRGRIFLSLWVLGWEDRRFRISSSSLRGGTHSLNQLQHH